jgi:hypothetical protein
LQQTVYFRKDALDQVGYLDEDLHYAMDWDILIRIGRRYPLLCIPEYMGCLREYPEAKSFAGGIRRASKSAICSNAIPASGSRPATSSTDFDTYRRGGIRPPPALQS